MSGGVPVAEYQVLYWRDIPSLVKATEAGREVSLRLPQRFQDAIDEAAVLLGQTDTDAYLEAWRWGAAASRPGPAEDVARAVARELEAAHPLVGQPAPFTET